MKTTISPLWGVAGRARAVAVALSLSLLTGCFWFQSNEKVAKAPKVYFVGIDVSGSFRNGPYFTDAMDFLSHYITIHLKGYGDAAKAKELFVASIGGRTPGEAKTFYPIQTFKYKSPKETAKFLKRTFNKGKPNPITDYNIFFKQVAERVRSKKLLLKPIEVILVTDGIPDLKNNKRKARASDFAKLNLRELENLSRNVTVRVLYTSALTGMNWQEHIPRRRIKIWSQDAKVMEQWKDPKIFQQAKPLAEQTRFFSWLKANVDPSVRKKVVALR